ncbi:helix-turn-helix domain-containing protein [Kitasatospora sp. NBC_01302]|uniref:helix-turn-helix domain-containing protein n=1 Tax=Kitasatospora sp. NBC_01302 TaxID=2903575 RepID=UPI002E0EE16A|nr:helix-turn-helix domain-containing protein [Kitasatospora sp. NBC_01302]
MSSQLGPLLHGLRREAGLTQEQLARRSGLGVRTIHRLETGKPTDARMGTVKQVAQALADALGRDRDDVWRDLLAARRDGDAAAEATGAAPTAPAPEESATPAPAPAPAPDPVRVGVLPPRGALAEVAESLARDVHSRWIREEEQRRIHDPFPLPLRWRSAPEGLLDHWGNISGALPGAAPVPLSLDGGLAQVTEVYRRIGSGRLVVLGRAGSGKTVLMLRFVLDYLAGRTDGDPVPVVFSIGSWDPTATALRDWLIERLLRDHPNLAARTPGRLTLAASLVDAGWILPVLDGFDEIAHGLHGAALRELNAISLPLLLTSRTEQFADAAATEVLRKAAGIELTDLTTDDLVHYLPRTARPTAPGPRSGPAATVWDPVLDGLSSSPDSRSSANLATVLSTPLMVLLARTRYSDVPGQDSAVLLDSARFPTPEALEEHLLAGFVPTVYRRRPKAPAGPGRPHRGWEPERARHYLGYLARHLDRPEQRDRQDLAWWQLSGSLSLFSRILAVVLACSLVTAASGFLVSAAVHLISGHGAASVLRADLADALLFGPTVGLAFGVIYGTMATLSGNAFEPSRMRPRLPGRGRGAGGAQPRRLRTSFCVGLLGGCTVGAGYGPARLVAQEHYGTLPAGGTAIRAMLVDSLLFGLLFGVAGALVLTLMAALETPLDPGSAATPADLLAVNRGTVVRQALLFLPLLTLAITFGGRLIADLFQGFLGPLSWHLLPGFVIGATGGLAGALCYALALTAWGQWVLFTRIWLPLTGRLPWATAAFLDDAYHRGVLRQVGAVYQFRHARLQSHLGSIPGSGRPAPAPLPPARAPERVRSR